MSGGQAAPAGSPALPPLAAKVLLSASAASVAETATYPLDLLKTRLQLQASCPARPGVALAWPSFYPPARSLAHHIWHRPAVHLPFSTTGS